MTKRKREGSNSAVKDAKSIIPALPEPSEAERAAIAIAKARHDTRQARVKSGLQITKTGPVMANPHTDGRGWEIRLRNALGTPSKEFLDWCLNQIINVFPKNGTINVPELDAVLAILDGASPENEIEAMLIVQMAITHALALRSAGAMAKSKEIPQQDSNGLALLRLSKTFTTQIDALAKLRRGGEQKVTVEHVHVYPGGQAVVGNVTHTGGGGAILANPEQPHAPNDPRALALAAGAPMLCQDTQRQALPVPHCTREEAMPDARRGSGIGRTEGTA
jgi:hypothetical protein